MNTQDVNETGRRFHKGLYTSIGELILLSVVSRTKEPLYGYQIGKIIEKDNEGLPIIKLGTLYPVLRSLEREGLLESHIDPSVTGPPRRYYRITESGIEALAQLTQTWNQAKLFVDNILTGGNHDK